MSYFDDLKAEPHRFNFYAVLRELERVSGGKPRIGDSATLSEEAVVLGQDPYLAFPAADISEYSSTSSGTPRLLLRFLGMFGPQGALPLHVTDEAYLWVRNRDPTFARFVDIISTRFLQLFYRAWADARPIAQFERPEGDRFCDFLGSFEGIGSPAFQDADSVEDIGKIQFAGLLNMKAKTASSLAQFLRGLFGIDVEIEEWIETWLSFDKDDYMRLGRRSASLGIDSFVGQRARSINERFRVRIKCDDFADYEGLLPGGAQSARVADAVFFFCGYRQEFDIELGIEATKAPAICLGKAGRLGWTSWFSKTAQPEAGTFYFDARFDPMARRRASEARQAP